MGLEGDSMGHRATWADPRFATDPVAPGARARRAVSCTPRPRPARTWASCAGSRPTGVLATRSVDEVLALERGLRLPHAAALRTVRGRSGRRPARPVSHPRVRQERRDHRRLPLSREPTGTTWSRSSRVHVVRVARSLHGTGVNPGWLSDVLPLTLSGMSARIDRIYVRESTEFAFYPSPEVMFDLMGFGCSEDAYAAHSKRYVGWLSGSLPGEPDARGRRARDPPRRDPLRVRGATRGPEDYEIAAGTVAEGDASRGSASFGAESPADAPAIVLETVFMARREVAPDWPATGFVCRVEGKPTPHPRGRPRLAVERAHRDRGARRPRDPGGLRCGARHPHLPRPPPHPRATHTSAGAPAMSEPSGGELRARALDAPGVPRAGPRRSCNEFVNRGMGYPAPVYIFHAVKLALFVAGWMFFCSFTPGNGESRRARRVDLRAHRVPEGLPVGEPRRGRRLRVHQRSARGSLRAALHGVPPLPPTRAP